MIKAIIFDLQGTLVENGIYPSPLKQTKYVLRIESKFDEFVLRFERSFMTKSFSSLKDGLNSACEEFGVKPPEFVVEKLVGIWNKNKLLSTLNPDAIRILEELHKEYKLVLAANIDCFSKDIIEKFKLNDYFDIISLSCDSGYLKHDKEFFSIPLESLGISPENALMVGDSIESDMECAKNSGLKSILLDARESREYPDKISSLQQLKEKLEKM